MQTVGNPFVPALAADARHEGGISLQSTETFYLVIRCLTQHHDTSQGIAHIAIAGRLTAPRRAIHHGGFPLYPHHGIVVIHQFRPFDILKPQSRVRAFARAAGPEKEICPPLMAHHGGMEERRLLVGRSQGKEHHQGIVDSHLRVLAGGDEPALAVVGSADQPTGRFLPPAVFENGLTISGPATDDGLSLFLLPQLLGVTGGRFLRPFGSKRAKPERFCYIDFERCNASAIPLYCKRLIVRHQLKDLCLSADADHMPCHLIISRFHHLRPQRYKRISRKQTFSR